MTALRYVALSEGLRYFFKLLKSILKKYKSNLTRVLSLVVLQDGSLASGGYDKTFVSGI